MSGNVSVLKYQDLYKIHKIQNSVNLAEDQDPPLIDTVWRPGSSLKITMSSLQRTHLQDCQLKYNLNLNELIMRSD